MSGVIGTGGHIDHGKTALVAALTGEDTDRLPEEKRRGISIDLGFSRLEIAGARYGIVDVPGHEDFIRNMLAGATGMDVLLLAVAADEGVMPQTREHVAIAALLAVPRALVALTKADLVEPEWLDLVRDDVASFLAGTRFADAPVLPVASTTGEGVDALRAALADLAAPVRRPTDDLFRLPVDRVFTITGTGTVVTGTVWSGALSHDDAVRVQPGGREVRVRGLQVHGVDADRVTAGQRAAVALTGVDRDEVRRGHTLVMDPAWSPTSILTVRLRVLRDTGWAVAQRQRVRVHLGTAEVMARVRLLDTGRLDPGEEGWAQLRLEAPLLARAGDRCVLRSYSPVTTIAGGIVAEPAAPRRKRLDPALVERLRRRAADDAPRGRQGMEAAAAVEVVAAVVEEAGADGAPLEALPVEAGIAPGLVREVLTGAGFVVAGGRAFPAPAAGAAADGMLAAVDEHHREWPLRTGIELEELRRAATGHPALVQRTLDGLIADGALESRDGRIARAGFRPSPDRDQQRRVDRILALLGETGVTPPEPDALAAVAGDGSDSLEELLRFMEGDGLIVRLQPGIYLSRAVAEELGAAVRTRLGGRSGLGPADFRPVVAVSRKHLIPILEYLDLIGVTVRQTDGRSVPATRSGV